MIIFRDPSKNALLRGKSLKRNIGVHCPPQTHFLSFKKCVFSLLVWLWTPKMTQNPKKLKKVTVFVVFWQNPFDNRFSKSKKNWNSSIFRSVFPDIGCPYLSLRCPLKCSEVIGVLEVYHIGVRSPHKTRPERLKTLQSVWASNECLFSNKHKNHQYYYFQISSLFYYFELVCSIRSFCSSLNPQKSLQLKSSRRVGVPSFFLDF